MATTILGVTGKKGHGKDTFAARLVTHHGFTRLGFADPLKEMALDIDPVIGYDASYLRDLYLSDIVSSAGWDEAKQLPTVRSYLQCLGVAVRNRLGENAWVTALANKAALVPGPVCVTDVRFINEALWVQGVGELVRVVRPDYKDDGDTHVSETELDRWVSDHFVVNCGGIDRLHGVADSIAENLRMRGRLFTSARV